MKHIYLNLKRFDLPAAMGGVNTLCPPGGWAAALTRELQEGLEQYPTVEFTAFFPEAHLLQAFAARKNGTPLRIGCQGVSPLPLQADGGTALLPAEAAAALGCGCALLGQRDSRDAIRSLMAEAGLPDESAVSRIIARQFRLCKDAGLQTVLCVGEGPGQDFRTAVPEQLRTGLSLLESWEDRRGIVIAYEPFGAADGAQIAQAARLAREITGGMDVVCTMTAENAVLLSRIPEISGGLISLTHTAPEKGFSPAEFHRIAEAYLGDAGNYFEID